MLIVWMSWPIETKFCQILLSKKTIFPPKSEKAADLKSPTALKNFLAETTGFEPVVVFKTTTV